MSCTACGGTCESAFRAHGYAIEKCRACGLGRALVDDFEPSAYYTRDYFQGGHSDGYGDYEGSADVLRREFEGSLDAIRAQGFKGGRLLEIGCAYGYFLDVASALFDVHGVEIADAAASAARARGHQVVTGVATQQNLGVNNDVVVMLDVVEHLPDPNEVLALASQSLRTGGALMLTTGDFGSAMSRLMGPKWRLMTPPQHLFFFTAKSMHAMLARHGLKVVSLTYPWKKVPLSLIGYQLERLTHLPLARPSRQLRVGLPLNLFDAFRVIAVRN